MLLLHGFASTARINWHRPGTTALITDAGMRVIAPDQRAHGRTGGSHDPRDYPSGVLVDDALELMSGVDSFDVVGYSMGAAVALGVAARHAGVRRVVAGGVGLRVINESVDGDRIASALEADDPATIDDGFAKGFRDFADLTRQDRLALAALQRAGMPRVSVADLGKITAECLLIASVDDELATDAEELAAMLPNARVERITGTHLAAVTEAEFRRSVAAFVSR